MFKSDLPKNCPPSEVEEQEKSLYRLIEPDDLASSFKNHVELFPDRKDFLAECKAHGISFFDNLAPMKNLLLKENNAGKQIVRVEIRKEYGVLTKRPTKSGHYTFWAYSSFEPTMIKFELVH